MLLECQRYGCGRDGRTPLAHHFESHPQKPTLTRPAAFASATADKSDTLSHPLRRRGSAASRMGEGRGEGMFNSNDSFAASSALPRF
jgi:hypothetical protein